MALESYDSFESVKERLDEIVEAVGDEELSLDDALALYEEAVGLGLRASDLLEENIDAQQSVADAIEDAGEGPDGVPVTSDAPAAGEPVLQTNAPASA